MRQEIINFLSQLPDQEQYSLIKGNTDTKPKQFTIKRSSVSNLTFKNPHSPLCIVTHPRYQEFPTHSHDYIELMYVCSGNITHVFGENELSLQSDEIILLGKNSIHSILNTGANDIGVNFVISTELFEALLSNMRRNSHIKGNALEELLHQDGMPYLRFSAKESLSIRALMETIISMVFCEKNTNGYLLEQAMSLLLSQLAFHTDQNEANTINKKAIMRQKLLNYLHTTYSTATLTEAATMFDLSIPYFSRWIKQNFEKSFKELLMQERFSVACNLLCTTDLSIESIIEQTGYQDRSYFHRQFKTLYGMTPGAYRKKHPKRINGIHKPS